MEGTGMKQRIFVHDDELKINNRFLSGLESLRELRSKFDVVALSHPAFREQMAKLTKRQRDLRLGKKKYTTTSEFDDASVLIFDYDLIGSDPNVVWTSETVAYLARCFSDCGLILGVNLPGIYEFDLTLRETLESYADINVVAKQVANVGLWTERRKEFRPWYWPQLLDYLDTFFKRVEDVKSHIDEPILETIGLQEVTPILPRSVIEFVSGKDPSKTTFRDFVQHSGHGLRKKDRNTTLETISRLAAARISKWLETRLLPGQNVVIDAPHLVSRFPSLLEGKGTGRVALNRTTRFDDYRHVGVRHASIEEFRLKNSHWFSRPVWLWKKLVESETIKEESKPWEKVRSRFRFCEDISSFQDERLCKQFVAEVDSPYDRRYISPVNGVDYQPRVRLLSR
jgi:hypothetical protein